MNEWHYRLLYSVIMIPDLEPHLVNHIGGALYTLLKKRDLLTSDQLLLEWRPLYNLHERLLYSKNEALGLIKIPQSLPNTIRNLIRSAR